MLAAEKDTTSKCALTTETSTLRLKMTFSFNNLSTIICPLLAKASFFALLGPLMGYYQVYLAHYNRVKTAFITYLDLNVYKIYALPLCNAPVNFQRLMQHVLGFRVGLDVLVYLDDVLIIAKDR